MGCIQSKQVTKSVVREDQRPILDSHRRQSQETSSDVNVLLQQEEEQQLRGGNSRSSGLNAKADDSKKKPPSSSSIAAKEEVHDNNDDEDEEDSLGDNYHKIISSPSKQTSLNSGGHNSQVGSSNHSSGMTQLMEESFSSIGALAPEDYNTTRSANNNASNNLSTSGKDKSSKVKKENVLVTSPPNSPPSSTTQANDDDDDTKYWEYIFTTLSPYILDPEDLPSTLDYTISRMINNLSPAEVSFIKRRVKDSIQCVVYDNNEVGDGGGIGASTSGEGKESGRRRSAIKSKVGRLVGYGGSNHGSEKTSTGTTSSSTNDDLNSSLHPALDESSDRIKSSKHVYQKERLLDISVIRKIFEGGESSLRTLKSSVKEELVSRLDNSDVHTVATADAVVDEKNTTISYRRRTSTGGGKTNATTTSSSQQSEQESPKKSAEQLDAESIDSIDVYGSAFLLLLYMSESRWEYVTEIAKLSAKEAGLTLDVNKLILQEVEAEKVKQKEKEGGNANGSSSVMPKGMNIRQKQRWLAEQEKLKKEGSSKNGQDTPENDTKGKKKKIPLPPRAPSFTPPSEYYSKPELTLPNNGSEPSGIHFSSLCYLISMALRGSRNQRLHLLFYLLLPPKVLNSILASHPAGGLPTFLLEIMNEEKDDDGVVILSYDSLSYYYNYEGVLLPTSRGGENSKPPLTPRSSDKKSLCIDAKSSVEVLSSLLVDSFVKQHQQGSNSNTVYGTRKLMISLLETTDEAASSETAVDQSSSLSSMKCQEVSAMLQQGTSSTSLTPKETDEFSKFAELSAALIHNSSQMSNNSSTKNNEEEEEEEVVRLSWSMKDFVEWSNYAIDDTVLDTIMRRLFGTGILPCPSMECQLVSQRWIDWNLQHLETNNDDDGDIASDRVDGVPTPVRPGGLRGIFTNQYESDHPSDEAPPSTAVGEFNCVWGGIGGVDGKGGLGHGVLYCIDKKWWDDWVAFTGWKLGSSTDEGRGIGNNNSRSSLKRPRELSTEQLIDRSPDSPYVAGSRGSYEIMKQNVVHGTDFVLVPPGVWNVLYEMYGGGPPLPRMVLPSHDGNSEHIMNGGINNGEGVVATVQDDSVEVISSKSQELSNVIERYPQAIPASVRVAIHPWLLHCQICDPTQPYRRGDTGPMSIRMMAMPDQPLWRLFAEIVVRLPISYPKARDSQGEGRARLWRFEVANGNKAPNPASRYGPWALLCKNRHAEIPLQNTPSYDKYEEQWETYADQHSVESIGLTDGMRLMLEFAVVNKDGSFAWPREAAAKATTARRIADEDAIFRLWLRGLDADGEPLKTPIMRKTIDAMDSTGRWYQAIIVNVDNTTNGDNADSSNENNGKPAGFRENTHIRVHFNENHEEWIEVKSDRLSVMGRMTAGSMRHLESHNSDDATATSEPAKPETKASRIAAGINKKKDANNEVASPESSTVCLFPGYGACGLINLGNTCYANSGWQCMSYLPLLRSYLLSGQFKINGDMNRDNPLGTGGKILDEFSELLHFMWSGKYGARAPQKFRSTLAKCRSQYCGADQQDAQELLNDMLDMLHEDGNRVKNKPYVEALEDKFIEKTNLTRVGQEAWRRFLRRNRSAISDLSMGQIYNKVTCPVCNHSSKNFDPFNMLSLPFPTVAEVIFQCTIVRRATALNCPNTLASVGKKTSSSRDKIRSSANIPSPPSKELIFEEYLIPMSRLADIGDLKMKLQNLSGIPLKDLRVCKREDIPTSIGDSRNSFTNTYTKVTALPDKEGPCVKLLQSESLDDVSSPTIARIIAFETTLRMRPVQSLLASSGVSTNSGASTKHGETTDDETTASEFSCDDSNRAASNAALQDRLEEKLAQEHLKVYGDDKECTVFDTNPTPLAKVISRSLWPKTTKDFTLGLRVDAIDHRNHWFPGSVIEIVVDGGGVKEEKPEGEEEEADEEPSEPVAKVKIHFDNFSAKWDETYSIESFTEGRVCPLYSHATPRPKPTEFVVHHRGVDRKTKKKYLFGQSVFIQCHNEWSTARAGAHILAQASRFLEVSHFKSNSNGEKLNAVDMKIAEKERHEARKIISKVIEALIRSDRKYVESAIKNGSEAQKDEDASPFDVSNMSQILSKKLSEVLPLLPFDVRVTTANSPLGANDEEASFPFSLVRTIGNYMNARHALVLHWREKPDNVNPNGSTSSSKRHGQFLYSPPFLASHPQSRDLLKEDQKDPSGGNALKRHPSSSHGGLHIGVCLTEFCKEQSLDATGCWRCPQCKVEREGKQSMTLWNLPDLLTFHLKRFNASSRWREKISTKVDFPLTGLNMREWCNKESPLCLESDDEAFVYDLVGVVNHYGGMTGGHYVATCKATACSPDGEEEVAYNFNGSGIADLDATEEEATPSSGWRLGGRTKEKEASSNAAAKSVAESAEPLWLQFDDDLVEPVPPRNVVSETAYVLFYRRRRMHPANIARYTTLA